MYVVIRLLVADCGMYLQLSKLSSLSCLINNYPPYFLDFIPKTFLFVISALFVNKDISS